jgi:hypothetical protein
MGERPMTINELLTELDTFPRPGSYEGALEEATRVIPAAAMTIRQLRIAEIRADVEDHRDMT